jgi:hypothetical protein
MIGTEIGVHPKTAQKTGKTATQKRGQQNS